MAKQKNIGLTIFVVCCAIYARTALLAPTKEELKDPSIAAKSRLYRGEADQRGLLHGMRYYVLGVGVIGLLIALEDYFVAKSSKKSRTRREPTTGSVTPRAK